MGFPSRAFLRYNTFYDILGIGKNASNEEIKKAYRKLSLKFHPDKNENDPYFSQMFRQVNLAYSTLINEEERRKYNAQLNSWQDSENAKERLKRIERELLQREHALQVKERDIIQRNQNGRVSTRTVSHKKNSALPVKIKHVKYLFWVVIIFLVFAIGSKREKTEITPKNTSMKEIIKKPLKNKVKSKLKRNSVRQKVDTVTNLKPVSIDMTEIDTLKY